MLENIDVVQELKDFFGRTPEGRGILEKRAARIAEERQGLIKRLAPLRRRPDTSKEQEAATAALKRLEAARAEAEAAGRAYWAAAAAEAGKRHDRDTARGLLEAELRATAPACLHAFAVQLRDEQNELMATVPSVVPEHKFVKRAVR